MKAYLSLLLFLLLGPSLLAQDLIALLDETLTVNSMTALTGNTRNTASATLPENAKGYVYRISVAKKGESPVGNGLFALLKKFGSTNISIGASLAQFAIQSNDNEAVDAFIFNTVYDADNFYKKNDGNWSACKSMYNRVNSCFSSNDCVGERLYFGFRNNNIRQGLDVRIEVVAIIDTSTSAARKYSYTIVNFTNTELKYSISLDKTDWKPITVRSGYQHTFTFEETQIFIKIYTGNTNFVLYKITPDNRYKLIYNESKKMWDVVHY